MWRLGMFFVMVLLVFGVWMQCAAPCSMHQFSTIGDVPVRCLK